MIDPIGKVFGRLMIVERVTDASKNSKWLCQCECGARKAVFLKALRSGATVSCGCFRKEFSREKATTHGLTQSHRREYLVWQAMKNRCANPNVAAYPKYGGQGIKVCARWRKSFAAFAADMGPRPPGGTVDRLDGSKGYGPDNCRWRSRTRQANNTVSNVHVRFGDVLLTIAEAAAEAGLHYSTLHSRIRRGVPEAQWFDPV